MQIMVYANIRCYLDEISCAAMLTFLMSIKSLNQFRSMPSKLPVAVLQVGFYTIYLWQALTPVQAGSLPLANDIPEEVLRAEIITEARSPVDGEALSAADFAELVVVTQEKLDRLRSSVPRGAFDAFRIRRIL